MTYRPINLLRLLPNPVKVYGVLSINEVDLGVHARSPNIPPLIVHNRLVRGRPGNLTLITHHHRANLRSFWHRRRQARHEVYLAPALPGARHHHACHHLVYLAPASRVNATNVLNIYLIFDVYAFSVMYTHGMVLMTQSFFANRCVTYSFDLQDVCTLFILECYFIITYCKLSNSDAQVLEQRTRA